MGKLDCRKAGVALIIALGTVLIVAILSLVMLRHISSSSSLTQHQVGRTQAYYAAKAGLNYAYDKLRRGDDPNWSPPGVDASYTYQLCNTNRADCVIGAVGPGDFNELDLPISIVRVLITVADGTNGTVIVNDPFTSVPIPGCNPCVPPTGSSYCICTSTHYANLD
ncbi:MAG: hypothetical protein ABIG56_03285 [Candidatus Omnitrophota bacterium]